MSCTRSLACAAILAAVASGSASADWVRDFRVGALYHTNISNSDRAAEERDDFAFLAQARFGKFTELVTNLRLTVTAEADGEVFTQYSDLDHLGIGARAALRYRFGLGAMAPFVRLEGSGGYTTFGNDLQNGARYSIGVTAGKRLTQQLAFDSSWFFDGNSARHRVFERPGHTFTFHAMFDATERTRLTAGYAFRDGEVVSYAIPPRPDLVALANDRVLVNTFGLPRQSYNLDAQTHTLSAGISQGITDQVSLNLRYEWQHTSRAHVSYVGHVARFSLHAAF